MQKKMKERMERVSNKKEMTAKKTVQHTKRYLMQIIIFIKCFVSSLNEKGTKAHLQLIQYTHVYIQMNTHVFFILSFGCLLYGQVCIVIRRTQIVSYLI